MIFGVVHIANKKKYILILGKGSKNSLVDSKLIAEKEYSEDFTAEYKFCFELFELNWMGRINIYLLIVLKSINFKEKILM